MPRDLVTEFKEPYLNSLGNLVEITHLEITYYIPSDDNKRFITLPIDALNDFANKRGINGPYVSETIRKEEAIERGLISNT